jgi:hypothetical protein
MRLEEQKRLELQVGAKRAKEEAERLYRQRLERLDQEVKYEERREKDEAKKKRDLINNAHNPTDNGDDHSNLVDELFQPIFPNQNLQTSQAGVIIVDSIPKPKPDENLDEYIFSKLPLHTFKAMQHQNIQKNRLNNHYYR